MTFEPKVVANQLLTEPGENILDLKYNLIILWSHSLS